MKAVVCCYLYVRGLCASVGTIDTIFQALLVLAVLACAVTARNWDQLDNYSFEDYVAEYPLK